MVTGGSAGLGLVIAAELLRQNYRVVIVGRDQQRLDAASEHLKESGTSGAAVLCHRCDLADRSEVAELFRFVHDRCGRLDVLVNNVGASDRGRIENLAVDRLDELFRQNVHTALLCCQAAIPMLEASGGSIVNIGSLAAKVGARYIGGYAAAKHALAGLTMQLRLELRPKGIHVGLVSPGPIRRDDAGTRYAGLADDDTLPSQAAQPGGGTRVKGLAPQRVADSVVRCVRKRTPDVVLPRYLRPLIAAGHAVPRLGDWLLLKFSSSPE